MIKFVAAVFSLLLFTACSAVNLHEQSIVLIDTDKGMGTGFYIKNEGIIMTAAHVVDDAKTINVSNDNGEAEAFLIYSNEKDDVAILVTAMYGDALAINCNRVKAGDDLKIVGHPLGWENYMYREGRVISEYPVISDNWIPYDGTILPGDSGSPIFRNGKVVGLVSAGVTLGFTKHMTNFNLMVPSDILCSNLSNLEYTWKKDFK